MTPITATRTILRIRCARVGRPNRKLAKAAGGAGSDLRPAICFAFFSASRIKLICFSRSTRERAIVCRTRTSISSIEGSPPLRERLCDPLW